MGSGIARGRVHTTATTTVESRNNGGHTPNNRLIETRRLGLPCTSLIERFLFECCKTKTKTKVITLANHKEHRQYSEPIKTRSNYM